MKALVIVFLLILVMQVSGADRVVLVEEFISCYCPYCWTAEPAMNAFVNNHSGDSLAVIRVHTSYPSGDPIYNANPSQQNVRFSLYGGGGVPNIMVDGILSPYSSGLEAAYNTRISVPTNLKIFVCRNGNDETGTISIGLVAEDTIATSVVIRLFSTIIEDNVPGAGYWGSSEFDQAFRYNIFASMGPAVVFTGPYPDTLYFEADYDVTSWVNDNLYLVTFVQEYMGAGNLDIINANLSKFTDLETGISAGSGDSAAPELIIHSNPSVGNIHVSVELQQDSDYGVLSVYDTTGRLIVSRNVSEYNSFDIDEPGLYIVRLETSGEAVTESVVVIR